jgi:hypothetical protein
MDVFLVVCKVTKRELVCSSVFHVTLNRLWRHGWWVKIIDRQHSYKNHEDITVWRANLLLVNNYWELDIGGTLFVPCGFSLTGKNQIIFIIACYQLSTDYVSCYVLFEVTCLYYDILFRTETYCLICFGWITQLGTCFAKALQCWCPKWKFMRTTSYSERHCPM